MSEGIFYRVVGGEPLEFCRDYRARRSAARVAFFDFAKTKGAKGFIEWWGQIGGLIFERGTEIPAGWIKHKRAAADGSTIYVPSKKNEAGKALRAEMDSLEREPRGYEFSERFGTPSNLTYRKSADNWGSMALNAVFPDSAFIAWLDDGDSFWVVLPDVDTAIASKVAEGYACEPASWAPPADLERTSRARFDLAVAAAKVAEEEA